MLAVKSVVQTSPASLSADSRIFVNNSCLSDESSSGIFNPEASTNKGLCLAVSVGSSSFVSVGLPLSSAST